MNVGFVGAFRQHHQCLGRVFVSIQGVAEVEVPEGELAEVAEGEDGAEAPEGQEESSE